jgi:pimeloyl-CoA synthetase
LEPLLIEIEGIPRDTTRDAFLRQLEVLRRLGIEGRAAMTFELSDNLRQIVKDGVRHRHPDWDEAHVKEEFLRIVLGDRLYDEAYGKSQSSAG